MKCCRASFSNLFHGSHTAMTSIHDRSGEVQSSRTQNGNFMIFKLDGKVFGIFRPANRESIVDFTYFIEQLYFVGLLVQKIFTDRNALCFSCFQI